jgi:hypothetical protein
MSDRGERIDMTREEAARRRVACALRDIEAAQNLLANASAALSSLYGVNPVPTALMRLHGQVKRTWYQLDRKREKAHDGRGKPIVLDHDPNAYEDQWGPLPATGEATATARSGS